MTRLRFGHQKTNKQETSHDSTQRCPSARRHLARNPQGPTWHRPFHMIRFGLALLGLGVALTVLLLSTQLEVRESAEGRLIGWLQQRQPRVPTPVSADVPLELRMEERLGPDQAVDALPVITVATILEPIAAEPVVQAPMDETVLAADPKELPREQAKVTYWLSKKYRVAPEPLSVLVAEAWQIGQKSRIDWTLILAVMAVESSFNPFAQSSVGAQGLMQVMTRIHTEKYDNVGGDLAAFDPVTNLRVGAQVLLECIERAGSLQAGLKYYVGAANLSSDNGYSKRVLAEQARLKKVAAGRAVS